MSLNDLSASIHHQDIPADRVSSERYIQSSLRAGDLSSETSADKPRLGIHLMSSGSSAGSTAQPAVWLLVLPLEGNLWLGESSAERINTDDPISHSVSRCCCSAQLLTSTHPSSVSQLYVTLDIQQQTETRLHVSALQNSSLPPHCLSYQHCPR